MRPADITQLFGYLYWIRDQALAQTARLAPEAFVDPSTVAYRDLRATLVHELDVERSWRLRLQGASKERWDVTLEPADYPDIATLADHWRRHEAETRDWVSGLSEAQLEEPTTVNELDGFPLSTYLIHIVMHGVESLSAAAILLDRAGRSMGDVGFLDFIDVASARD
jgi:uncharacterized damage-inducible protein DinB